MVCRSNDRRVARPSRGRRRPRGRTAQFGIRGRVGTVGGRRCRRAPDGGSRLSAAMPDLTDYLKVLVDRRGSDLHIKVGQAPVVRVDAELMPIDFPKLTAQDTERMAFEILPEKLATEFEEFGGADFAHSIAGLGRFRVNAFRQRG